MQDESFFQKLSKAITRTRAKKPNKEYNDLRFMMTAIKQHSCYSSISKDDLYQMVAEDLQLYSTDNKDSFRSFFKFIERLRQPVNDT